MSDDSRPFRLIRGGKDPHLVAGVQVTPAPRSDPPFPVDALVLEEDTYLVLSARVRLPERSEHPIRVMTAVWEAEPEPPGSVVVRSGMRPELLAVVHDLDEDPTWREEWVAEALAVALAEAGRRKVVALGMEPLGCVHGRMARGRFDELLEAALEAGAPEGLERIWVVEKEEREAGKT